MILNLLNLAGMLPHHIEISANPCVQRCEYCFAKIWKREFFTVENIVNSIIREEKKKNGLLPFYIRKREPIALSNRTDPLCHPDWKNLFKILKELGFPLYLETKGSLDMLDLIEILNKKDEIYFTITSRNQKYEEKNILTNDKKIEFAKILSENGISVIVGVNPYMKEKTSVDDVLSMIDYIKPAGVVVREYHDPDHNNIKHLYPMNEDKSGKTESDILEIGKKLQKKKIPVDVNGMQNDMSFFNDEKLVVTLQDNKKYFNNSSIVCDKIMVIMNKKIKKKEYDGYEFIEYWFEDFLEDFEYEIKEHSKAIATKYCGFGRAFSNVDLPRTMDYETYLKFLWNKYKLFNQSHYYSTDEKDKYGNLILLYELQNGGSDGKV